MSDKPRNARRRIARLEARLRGRGVSAETLRGLDPLRLDWREWGLRAALMILET